MSAALYPVEITHARTAPLRNVFRYDSYLWLVDVDDLPRWPRLLAGFHAKDHFDGKAAGIRAGLEAFLLREGITPPGGRVVMLAGARVLGYVFNPISVFWCHDEAGRCRIAVVEVHNTYGQRHCYLVRLDERGGAEADKAFYVSPFEPVEGRYRMSLPEPGERLQLSVTLHRPVPPGGGAPAPPFVAAVRGVRRPATWPWLLRMVARHPVAPLIGAARIRRQGIGLWLRGLPVVPRPVVREEFTASRGRSGDDVAAR